MSKRRHPISACDQRVDALIGALAVLEEVPRLDDVTLGVLEVQGAVTPVVLHRPAAGHAERLKALDQVAELAAADRQGEVHVGAALVAEFLAARGPQPEARALAAGEPHTVVL